MREEYYLVRAVGVDVYSERITKPSWAIIKAATSEEAAKKFLANENNLSYLEGYGEFNIEVKPNLNGSPGFRLDVKREEVVTVKWSLA